MTNPTSETNPVAIIDTSLGEISIELFADLAPKTVENFITYINESFYGGTVFHRVIKGFMIQGGGFTKDLNQKATNEQIENEARDELKNIKGSVAMARTMAPHSASSQFFINCSDNDFLDKAKSGDNWGYAVFAQVVGGLDIVEAIEKVDTSGRRSVGPGLQDVPLEPVIINSISLK